MATVVLIPGAGGPAWYWHRLVPQLRERGNDAVAVGLHAGDAAGLAQCADTVIERSATGGTPLSAWPAVKTRFLQARDDRYFPVEMQRRVVREHLGFAPERCMADSRVALSRPRDLAERLDGHWAQRRA